MRICVVRTDKMGDMVLTLPIIQGLKEVNKDYQIDVVCSGANQKICDRFNSIDNIFLLQNKFLEIYKTISNLRKRNYDYIFTFSPGILSILISILSKSKIKSLMILKSRYKNTYKGKLLEKVLGRIFFNKCMIIDRQLRYSQNNPIHQTKVMMELVTKNGLDLNEDTDIKNIFEFNKMNLNTRKLCLLHLSSKWVNNISGFATSKFQRLYSRSAFLKISPYVKALLADGLLKGIFITSSIPSTNIAILSRP